MVTRNYKNTEEKVSLLGLGCMRFPLEKDSEGNEIIDKEKTYEIIDYAYKNGVNYFDTANGYIGGQSEPFMGEALKQYPRESFFLATKMPFWALETREDMIAKFYSQLERCQVEYFDYYLLHAMSTEMWAKAEKFGALEFLSKMKEEGKIRKFGFSFHDKPELLQTIVDAHDWDFAQLQINYIDWEKQDAKKQYEILEAKGIPCIVMEPVRGGLLASPCSESDEIFKKANPDESVASWAVKYVASLPNVITILSGMSNMEQVIDNVKTCSEFKPLTKEEYAVIDAALDAYNKKHTVPCTACRYCIDCPIEIDIAKVFEVYNIYATGNDMMRFKNEYNKLDDDKKADKCIECGACMTHCPQFINIPDKLKMVSEVVSK